MVEAMTISGKFTQQDQTDLKKVFDVIAERQPDAEYMLTFDGSDAHFEGSYTEEDLLELATAFRTIEQRQPDEDFYFVLTKANLSVEDGQALVRKLFAHIPIEGNKPWFATILFQDIEQRTRELFESITLWAQEFVPMWVVFDRNTSDFPGKWVARMNLTLPGRNRLTNFIITHDTLEGLREVLPRGLTRLERDPRDNKNIVEVWL